MHIPADGMLDGFESDEEDFEEEEEDDEEEVRDRNLLQREERERGHSRQQEHDTAARFLGRGRKTEEAVSVPHYYEEYLAWTLKARIGEEKWKVVRVLGLSVNSKPEYCEFNSRSEALNRLLDVLDGIKECSQVVTVATTNHLESLDEALCR